MPEKIDIYRNKKMDADIAVSGLKQIKPPALVYTVVIELDSKIFKQVKSDDVMLRDFRKVADEVYGNVTKSVKSKLVAFDKLAQEMRDKNAPEDKIKEQLAGLDKSIRTDVTKFANEATQAVILNVWKKYAQKKKEYLMYQLGIVATITGTAAGLATSIALMAATPFSGGASAAIGIIGMVASTVTIAKEVASAAMEVETSSKLLEKQIAIVAAASKNLVTRKLNEYSAAVISQFLGVAQPSLKQIASLVDTCDKKLTGIDIKTHEMSKKLNRILDEQMKLRKEFMNMVHERAKKYPSAKALQDEKTIEKKLDDHLAANYAAVDKAITTVEKLHERFVAADKVLHKPPELGGKDLKAKAEALIKLRTIDEKLLVDFLAIGSIALGALSGNGIAKGAANLAEGLGPAAGGYAINVIKSKVFGGSFLESTS